MDIEQILLIVGMVVLLGGFMFYSSYRTKKKNAQMAEMTNKLVVGEKVQTIGGIVGTITEVNKEEDTITISTGTSTVVFNKQAVYPFGFFDKPKPASEESQPVAPEAETEPSENMDTIISDFDAPIQEVEVKTKKASKKSKKTTENTAKFE